jgi:hypothetical protein
MRCAQPAELAELLDVQDAHRCAGQLHAARARRAGLQALVERGPMSNGKGSTRRPKAVSDAELAERWARTFGAAHGKHILLKDECPAFDVVADQAYRLAVQRGEPVFFEYPMSDLHQP